LNECALALAPCHGAQQWSRLCQNQGLGGGAIHGQLTIDLKQTRIDSPVQFTKKGRLAP
jgi:predicted outer membrane repeat protein